MKAIRQIKSIALSETRWLAYATAGVAGAFGLSSSAEAEIHYSGNVFIKLTGNAQASLPLSNGASLVFKNIFRGSTFVQWFEFLIKGATSGSARGRSYGFGIPFLSNLPSGEAVSAGKFSSVAGNPPWGVLISDWSDGQFSPPEFERLRGFVGFRFSTGNGLQYGWARIQTRDDNHHHIHDLIKDYAWGDVGDAILTGQTHSLQPANANSVPGSLGLLALGAQGLEAWRTQRMPKSN
ncbi:MAG TPA: hypothetical protein VGI60_14775 [Chthoniobacterales bacterium]|jgi:hypothetical protein